MPTNNTGALDNKFKKRTTKTPAQAAKKNAQNAVDNLRDLGARLFKAEKLELMDDVRAAIQVTEALVAKL